MATETSPIVTVDVMRHSDGERVGRVEMDAAERESYATCSHRAFQWPEGVARAGDVLTDRQIEEFGLRPETVVWLDV